jgi:hypothetical protein
MGKKEMEALVSDLGKEVGIPELELDEDGYCCLFFDDVVVNMEWDDENERLLLYTSVGDIPEDGREELFEKLLDANLFWKNTGGATLSIDNGEKRVVMTYELLLANVSFADFKTVLENFVNVAEAWMGQLKDFKPGGEETAAESLLEPDSMA